MNLDELVQSIPSNEHALREQLAHWVDVWKRNEESLEQLSYVIGKWHGGVWFKDTEASNGFYRNWRQFKSEAIDGIGGMTLNERLYVFGLFEIWDSASDHGRKKIRTKLKAQ
jgi:hypothetical protein